MKRELKYIPINIIRIPNISVRELKSKSEEWPLFVQDIYDWGVCEAITVIPDPEDKNGYLLENGKHRLSASRVALEQAKEKKDKAAIDRLSMIACQVFDRPISEIPWRQAALNFHHFETSPREYAQHLQRIFSMDEFRNISREEAVAKLNIQKSTSWINQQLNLAKLIPEAGELMDEGKIKLSAAYYLGKLPANEQAQFLEQAQTENVDDFNNIINKRLLEIRKEKKGEKAHHDPLADIKRKKVSEFKAKIIEIEAELKDNPKDTSLQAFYAGVLWACSLDEETKQAKQAEKQAKEKAKEEYLKLRRERMVEAQAAFSRQRKTISDQVKAEVGLN